MTPIEVINIAMVLGGLIIGTVATLFATAWANRVNRRIAQEAGSFRKPKITVSLLGKRLNREDTNEWWVLLHPGKEDEPVLYPLHFTIENGGDAPLKDAVLTIQASKLCIPAEVETEVVPISVGGAVATPG